MEVQKISKKNHMLGDVVRSAESLLFTSLP